MVELTWTEQPSGDGLYWYIDMDYVFPVQVEVEDGIVTLDATDYTVEELVQEGSHYAGPIVPITAPTVPEEIRTKLEKMYTTFIANLDNEEAEAEIV